MYFRYTVSPSYVERMMSIKNEEEIEHLKRVYLRDGVLFVRFLAWLETKVAEGCDITEAAWRPTEYWRKNNHFMGLAYENPGQWANAHFLVSRGFVVADMSLQHILNDDPDPVHARSLYPPHLHIFPSDNPSFSGDLGHSPRPPSPPGPYISQCHSRECQLGGNMILLLDIMTLTKIPVLDNGALGMHPIPVKIRGTLTTGITSSPRLTLPPAMLRRRTMMSSQEKDGREEKKIPNTCHRNRKGCGLDTYVSCSY